MKDYETVLLDTPISQEYSSYVLADFKTLELMGCQPLASDLGYIIYCLIIQ
jgi:hypothetical protein